MPVAFAKHRPKFRIVFLLTFPRSWCSKNGQNDLLILSPSDMISYPCFQLFIVDRVGKVEYLVPFSKSYLTTMTPESIPSILKIQARRASEWFDRALNNLSLFVSESFHRCADKPLACASASYFHKPEAYATAQKNLLKFALQQVYAFFKGNLLLRVPPPAICCCYLCNCRDFADVVFDDRVLSCPP